MMDGSLGSFGADDFKEHIHNLLTKRGVQHGLKASLRAQILRAARSDGFMKNGSIHSDTFTMDEKIAIGLITQFLSRKSMDLTLSVFLPACGVSKPEECLNARDLSELCHVDSSGDIFGEIIRTVRHEKIPVHDTRGISTQTEGSAHLELDERLAMIDQAYSIPHHKTISHNQLDDIQRTIQEQIEKSTQIKNERYLESQTALIRAEERVKFDRELIDMKEEYDKKNRTVRNDVFEREKRLAAETHQRHDEMDRTSYNQRQHILGELQRIQEKETELTRKSNQIAREAAEIENKQRTVSQIVKVQVESIIASYEAENSAEKERTIIARRKAETILKHVSEQEKELDEDKSTISRLRGNSSRLTAELAAERAAHSTVQIETGQLGAARSKIAEMTQELTRLNAETMNAGTYQAQAREVPALRQVLH